MYAVYMQISFRAPTAMCRAYVTLAISASATYTPHMILGALKLMYMKCCQDLFGNGITN